MTPGSGQGSGFTVQTRTAQVLDKDTVGEDGSDPIEPLGRDVREAKGRAKGRRLEAPRPYTEYSKDPKQEIANDAIP